MLRVPIDEARPGMTLALAIRHPERGFSLLKPGYVITDAVIAKLLDLGIHEVWIRYPNTKQIEQYVSPTVLQHQGRTFALLANAFETVHQDAHAELDYTRYRRTLRDLIETLVSDPTSASYIVEVGGAASSDLRHAAEVCFLSLLLGLKLQGYLVKQRRRLRPTDARNVISLGLGAMLHDIGKTQLPDDVLQGYEETRDESDPAWREHVHIGHKLVTGRVAPAASGIVLNHHQHFDGSGFPPIPALDARPRLLSGEDIHVFARIVCVANTFDRLHRSGDGVILPRVRVLRRMLSSPLMQRFDPVILAMLPLVVPPYAPGSTVTLSNGQRAAVLRWHPEAPCQPLVQVREEETTRRRQRRTPAEPPAYDLRERRDLLIVEQGGFDIAADNFRLIRPDLEAA